MQSHLDSEPWAGDLESTRSYLNDPDMKEAFHMEPTWRLILILGKYGTWHNAVRASLIHHKKAGV